MLFKNYDFKIQIGSDITVTRRWLTEDRVRAQRLLKRHLGEPVICKCKPDGVPMYIAATSKSHYLTTARGKTHDHAPSCPSYRADGKITNLGSYSRSAFREDSSGYFHLRTGAAPQPSPPFAHFTMRGLFHFLWEQSGLAICTPKTVASRTLFKASRNLIEVADRIKLDEGKFKVHIPSSGTLIEDSDWVMGQIRSVSKSKYSNRMSLSHEKKPLWISRETWQKIEGTEWLGPYDAPKLKRHAWVIGRVRTSNEGNISVDALQVLTLTKDYIPVHPDHEEFVDRLIDQERKFMIGLGYETGRSACDIVFTDTEEPEYISFKC